MYKTSYCLYSISHFFKKLSSRNQDEWLGWKDWLNKKFCDKFMEMNADSVRQQQEPTTPQQNKNIKELNDLIEAGANPQAIGRNARFNDEVEILPENQYLRDFLKQIKFDFGLSSYNEHSQLMKAIYKTLTAKNIKEMQDGKFAIDYLLNKQVSDDEELVIVDDEELIIEDLTESVDQNQQVPNNKDDIRKKVLGEAWLAAVKLIAQKKCGELLIYNRPEQQLINKTTSDVIKKLHKQDNSILHYTDNEGNNAMHILASSQDLAANQVLLGILETLDQDSANKLKLMQNKKGYNVLHKAVIYNHPNIVKHFLTNCLPEQKQILLLAKDVLNNNILHFAVRSSNLELVNIILQELDLDQKKSLFAAVNTSRGCTPTMDAIHDNKYSCELLRELIQYNTPSDLAKLLKKAIYEGKVEVIKCVLTEINGNLLTGHEECRLKVTLDDHTISEATDMVCLLIKFGVNIENTQGKTPLHLALESNDITRFQKLIEAGADLTIYDAKGKSSLDYVIEILDKDREQFMAILDIMPGKVLSGIYDSMLKKLPAHLSEIKKVINEKLMSKYPSENDLSKIMQKQINPMIKGKLKVGLSKPSTPKELISLGVQKSCSSNKNANNFSNLISIDKVKKKQKTVHSSGDNAPSDLGNVFARWVPGPKDAGDGHEIPEIKIGGGDSCEGDLYHDDIDSIVSYNQA